MYLLDKLLERPRLILKAPIKRQIAFHRVRPDRALFYLTFRCNSKCSTCTFWKRDKKQLESGELTLNQWKIIVDKLHKEGIRRVELFGGNILLRTDLLIPLMEHLKSREWKIFIPTNQIGLNQKTIETLVDCGVDILYISTDGTELHQNKIRGFEGADKLNTKTIRAIRDYREKVGRDQPWLVCNTTVSKFNIETLDDIPDYAIEMGFDEVHFEYAGEIPADAISRSLIDGLRPTPMYVKQNGESILASKAQARDLKRALARIKQKYRTAPILIQTINIDDLSEDDLWRGTIPHKKCYDERLEVNVDPYGNIVACPMIHNYAHGNLLTDDFNAIWNNARHRRFRELQNSGALAMCEHCILGVERNPSLWRSLKRNFKIYGVESLSRYLASKSRRVRNAGPTDLSSSEQTVK